MNYPPLYTLAEVAEALGVSERSLADGARARKFDHVRLAGRRFMTEEQVAALVQQSTVTSVSSAPTAMTHDEAMAALYRRMDDRKRRKNSRTSDNLA